ncbi:MAG: hypothetical protein WDZ74_02425 [Candidatus Paceibacterota bacterium]
MNDILVEQKEEKDTGWVFSVDVDGRTHTVTVPKEYYKKLTEGKETPESLVNRSFEFLLAREPKKSILKEFELPVIQHYFPEYETETALV